MYVCVCNAVSDNEVREVIERGATTTVAVTHACGAGGDCGTCIADIEAMLDEHAGKPPCRCTSAAA